VAAPSSLVTLAAGNAGCVRIVPAPDAGTGP